MITLTVIGFLAAALAASAVWNVRLLGEVQRLTGAAHAGSRPRGGQPPARPGTSLLTPAHAAAHADAMHEISGPFLPAGQHAQAWPRLTERTVPVKPTGDRAPWDTATRAQHVLSQELQDMRAQYIASGMRDAEKAGTLSVNRLRLLMAEAAQQAPAGPSAPRTGEVPDEAAQEPELAAGQERGAA